MTTTCGPMTKCNGEWITESRIGAKECGDKGLTYVCGADGKWVIGGADGKETCPCMTLCPDLRGCDGEILPKSRRLIGAEVCGLDRKMHICEENLIVPPEWTYGKKCACPGDPAPVAASVPPAANVPVPTSMSAIIAGVAFLFIMVIIVVLMLVMRKKSGAFDESSLHNIIMTPQSIIGSALI